MKLFKVMTGLLSIRLVDAKAVFAHFMVSNVAGWGVSNWESDISLAQAAHIDAFALDVAWGDANNVPSLDAAFQAAANKGFKLFFSLDYGGNGYWPEADTLSILQSYINRPAYYRHNNQPFVSTFEGPLASDQWVRLKQQTGAFFVPDWSSKGASVASGLSNGVVDGLFNWAAWPYGADDMFTVIDASYVNFLKSKPYMMPVAPMFFTNMPGFDGKNWLWRGDDLWYDRWQQVLTVQPEWVEIISWNDYGESHYIGPLHADGYEAFDRGKAPYNYVENMPHDGWRAFLPYVIDQYKNGQATIQREGVTAWFRLTPGNACGNGGTTGNTMSQQQCEVDPAKISQDRVFYSALLVSDSTVEVSIGGSVQAGTWDNRPQDNIGIFHGSVPFGGRTGNVVVTVKRSGVVVAQMVGNSPITATCKNSVMNWNAWVGYSAASSAASATSISVKAQSCVAGTGVGGYKGLCAFTCKSGYCPLSACTCTQLGKQIPEPTSLNKPGYPAPGIDGSFEGLCAYACNYGYCPSEVCSSTKTPFAAPSTDGPFPTCWKQACVSGRGKDNYDGLCSFSCGFGFCPEPCTCLITGDAKTPPKSNGKTGCPVVGLSADYIPLCAFVCSHGYCPEGACTLQPAGTVCATAQPETAGWRDVNCDFGTLPSDLADPSQRWKDAQADAAWADALQNYRDYLRANPNTNKQFIEIIADYFHGTSARLCSDPADDVCNEIIQCGQKNGLGVNSPAGYMILNSISNLHNLLFSFDKAITDTKAEFALSSSTIVTEFVNFSNSNQFAVTTDVLGLLFGLAAGLTFNSWLKNVPSFEKQDEAFNNIKDSVNNMISGGINLIKDTHLSGADGATVAAKFDVFARDVLGYFTLANQEIARKLFVGALGPYSTDFLTAALKGGAAAQAMTPNQAEIRNHLYMSIVGLLIPQAWTIGTTAATGGIHPFIMNAAGLPRKAGTTGCEVWDPSAYFDNRDIGVNAFVCAFETEPYWILLGHQYCYDGSRPNQSPCTYDIITLPPGLETINGVNYGGLRKEMMVSSAVIQFHKKEKNDLAFPDLTNEDNIINIAQNGMSIPGMFPLPICGIQEALANLHLTPGGNPNYPCNA